MKKKLNLKLLLGIISSILIVTALIVTAFAATDEEKGDAMTAIEAAFANYKIGDTQRVANDGYIGIPVEISTFYDASKGKTKAGYNGTPLIVYVVNTNTERIGKKTDVEIITDMLGRGYIVQVLDYMNNDKACTPALDWSTQTIRQNFKKGAYFTDNTYLTKGMYYDTVVVPAGYDVSLSNIFWETDKHGADGDLEKIVENWNTDLRGWSKNTVVYWKNAAGEQKATQNGFDGSAPVWYSDAKGTTAVAATDANASYIKLQHTKAVDITDCVGPDGTPIDLNLYMHVIYPTTTENDPLEPVPVMALANSSEYLSNGLNIADRPQLSGFIFNGYAGVVFDYLYQPMAQSDYYGYYDGRTELGALTGDRMNYGLHLYDDKRVNTAAMRYIRYLTLTEPGTYSFDTDSIGVFGNSKGGWFTFLGEKELTEKTTVTNGMTLAESIDARINAYTQKRIYEGHNGETRYQNGITADYTKNGVLIDGGELQPWLTYTDSEGNEKEILGYASWIYASCGSQHEDITEGHAPVFSALQLRDDFTTTHNLFAEITRNLDIPSMYVIVDYGHTCAYGPDYYYGYDTYQAMFDFANYYLNNAAVKVVYTDPAGNTGRIDTTPSITVKFTGAVSENEIAKVTLTSATHTATGAWTAIRGNTEWTFSSDALLPNTEYTLTVPADMKGDNGVAIGNAYTTSFFTESEDVAAVTVTKGTLGNYFTVTVPDTDAADAKIRFRVTNDAANIAELYTVSGFDPASPDSAAKGSLVGTVNLSGAGYYEIDVTEYVCEAEAGTSMTFLLTAKKAATETTNTISFSSSISSVKLGSYVRGSVANAPDGTAVAKVYVTPNIRTNGSMQYPNEKPFYVNTTLALTVNNLFGSTLVNSDLGRKYHVTIRFYDTDTRVIHLALNRVSGTMVHDDNSVLYNFMTEAGKWQDFSFDYTVYEPMYGKFGLSPKTLSMFLGSTGKDESPIYISGITVTETVTDIELASDKASLALGHRGEFYKKNGEAKAFTIGESGYDSFGAALAAAKSGDTVVMNKNYTFTDADDFTGWDSLEKITLNLNGYKLYAKSNNPIIHAAVKTAAVPKTIINITGGEIYLSSAALIGYKGSTATGKEKTFDINISGTDILNTADSTLTDFITEKSVEAGIITKVNVNLSDVNIDFTKRINAKNPVTLLSHGSADLFVSYKILGGSVYTDNFASLTFLENFKKAEFLKTADGNYTLLITGEGTVVPTIGVITDSAIAAYKPFSTENKITTYTIQASSLATKYGLIPSAYESVENYPFVFFDENGNFKGAYSAFVGNGQNGEGGVLGAAKSYVVNAWNGTSYGINPKEAFIVMRRDYTFGSESDVRFDNLAQLQGTINIDLCGYMLSSGTVGFPIFPASSKGFSGSASGNPIFPSTIIVNNGTIRQYINGIVAMSTWDSAGGGTIANKNFNFIFNGVTIGFTENAEAAGLTAHAGKPSGTPGAAAPFNFTYNDCTFDLRTTKSKYNPVIFSLKTVEGKYIKLTVDVNGGKIISDDPSTVTVFNTTTSDDYGSSITFGRGSDGEYIKYYAPTGGNAVNIGAYTNEDGEIYGFKKIGTEGTDDVYTLDVNPLVTKYGVVKDDFKSAETYPFVIFDADTKAWYGGYKTLREAVNAAKGRQANNSWDKATGTFTTAPLSSVILMRRDYTTVSGDYFDNYGQIKGTVTLDLGGHSLNQGTNASSIFWRVTIKGWSGNVYPSVINVKNGNMNVYSAAVIQTNVWATVGADMIYRPFTFNFDNVKFGFVSGATASNMLVDYFDEQNDASSVASILNLNYNNCIFDLKTNAPSGAVTLFNAAGGTKVWIKATVTVTGGEIKANALTLAQLFKTETTYGSSVKFLKDSEGKYTDLYITNGGAAPSGDIMTDAGAMCYAKLSTGSAETHYTLSNLKTPYGTIPANKSSIEDYPFAVFKLENGVYSYYGAYSMLYGKQSGNAMSAAIYDILKPNVWNTTSESYGSSERGVVILLRRDYTMGTSANEYFDNLAQAQGTIVIDLGGYSIYQNTASTRAIFEYTAKGWGDSGDEKIFPTKFVIKNGGFYVYGAPVMSLKCWDSVGNNTIAKKFTTIEFESVKFGFIRGATTNNLLITFINAQNTTGVAPIDVKFTDCTYDFNQEKTQSKVTLFNCDSTSTIRIKCNITVNGGKIFASDLGGVNLYALNKTYGSSMIFGKGSDGKYLSIESTSYPGYDKIFAIAGGEATFTATNESCVYILAPSEKTEYGYIPARFTSAEKYPYVVFKGGKFVFATSIFGKDASDSALHHSKSNGSVILVRRDVVYNEGQYNNLSQTNGSITIDLGGHTVSLAQTGNNAWLYAQKKTQYDSTVTIKNGTILNGKNAIVSFGSWKGSNNSYTGGNYFNIIFDGVTIGVLKGYSPSSMFYSQDNSINAVNTNATLEIKNCTIDLTNAPKTTLFAVNDPSKLIDTVVTVTNTKIKGNDLSGITFAEAITNENTSVTFDENVKLYIITGNAPKEEINTSSGKLVFIKTGTDGSYKVYKLADKALSDFSLKVSISLASDFIYNVYVPVRSDIASIILNGEALDINGLSLKEFDGKQYYHFTKELAASEAAEDVTVSVKILLTNGEEAKANYTLGIIKYATKVLDGNYSDVEKDLMRDMLSYIRIAYVYFDSADKDEVKTKIDAIIGEDYDLGSLPNTEMTRGDISYGLDGATMELSAKPAFRFYPETYEDGSFVYNLDSYVFKIGERSLSKECCTDSSGKTYFKITVYAYGMCETVNYEIQGTDIKGNYNIGNYYEHALSGEDALLVGVVERLWKYSESAGAYRNSVLSNSL